MIRVLVVDDDFRVANLHSTYVSNVPGFDVVGVANTAREAVEIASRLHPDLTLLDQYLPDASGTSIVRQLLCDVIMLTAASESAVVRNALGHGVVNYLVKPFTETDLAERLRAYARFRLQVTGGRTLDQSDIDRAIRTLHEGDRIDAAVRKGRSSHTAQLVIDAVRTSHDPVTAADVAEKLGSPAAPRSATFPTSPPTGESPSGCAMAPPAARSTSTAGAPRRQGDRRSGRWLTNRAPRFPESTTLGPKRSREVHKQCDEQMSQTIGGGRRPSPSRWS